MVMQFKTIEQKSGAVIGLYKDGKTQRQISEILEVPKSTVGDIIKKYDDLQLLSRIPGSGRRPSLETNEVDILVAKAEENPRISAGKLKTLLHESTEKNVCEQTIRNYLHMNNLFGRVACKKPLISEKNIKSRLEVAKSWSTWAMKKWNKVLFTDESKFNLFKSDGRTTVWRKPGERLNLKNVVPTVKYGGGSVLVWGSMSSNGAGKLAFIDGIMDSVEYCRILAENLDDSVELCGLADDFIFQQDNDPKHKSKFTKNYFDANDITPMFWPAQSPDLNPIENLWSFVEIELRKRIIKSVRDLKENIMDIWINIDKNFTKKLVNSMPKRVECLMRAKGGPINY